MNYLLHLLILVEIYLILSLSLNLVVGYAGVLSLCHAAFYGIGAYACALLMTGGTGAGATRELTIVLPVAVSFTILCSLAVSKPFFKLRGDYLTLASIGLQTLVFVVINNTTWLTNGAYGIAQIPEPTLFNFEVARISLPFTTGYTISFFLFSSVVTAACVWLLYRITVSPFGRALRAAREDELATTALGKNVKRLQTTAFAVAAGFAAVAGVLFACYAHYIDPTSFTLAESIFILSILILGGAGNFVGPVVGTVLMILLPEVLRFLQVPDAVAPNVRQIIYGTLILLIMRYRTQGIAGEYRFG